MAGSRRSKVALSWVLALGILGCSNGNGDGPGNRFVGQLDLRDIGGGQMKLLADFTYIDSDMKRWKAPEGYVTDGASIPRILWSVIGAPFAGEQVRAAVVHDVYCEGRYRTNETWKQVHRMFYEACLCAGVSGTRAKLMYAAVYYFGPRWPDPGASGPILDKQVVTQLRKTEAWQRWSKEVKADELSDAGLRYSRKDRAIILASPDTSQPVLVPKSARDGLRQAQQEMFDKCRKWIEEKEPTVAEIERWVFE